MPATQTSQTVLYTAAGVILASYCLVRLARRWILVPKFTILDDLPMVGKPRRDGKIPGRAIVCGGSVAGLFAAAVCADHFDTVTIIEPDSWTNEYGTDLPRENAFRETADGCQARVAGRSRVMQYLAIHTFSPPVLFALENLFPTLPGELELFGYKLSPFHIPFRYDGILTPDPFADAPEECPKTLWITREAFETLLRRLIVDSRPNVTFVTGSVTGFERSDSDDTRLKGVRIESASTEEGGAKTVEGAFVVDATGPQQHSFNIWLKQAGFPIPASTRITYDPHMGYDQNHWTIPPKHQARLDAILPDGFKEGLHLSFNVDWSTGEQKVLYLFVYERSQLVICTGGWDCSAHLHSIADLRQYAASLLASQHIPPWVDEFFDFMEEHGDECEPWSTGFKVGPLSYVKYAQLVEDAAKGKQGGGVGAVPKNWVAIGDAVMKLNPVYGQGCSKAAVDAITLNTTLHAIPSATFGISADVPTRFFSTVTPRTVGAWDGTKANDYGWASTTPTKGESLSRGNFQRQFGQQIILAGRKYPDVQKTFMLVNMFVAPGTDMFAPSLLGKVLWNWMFGF